jgi:hypothetical protein
MTKTNVKYEFKVEYLLHRGHHRWALREEILESDVDDIPTVEAYWNSLHEVGSVRLKSIKLMRIYVPA